MTEACLFCRIVEGSIPADVVLETDRVLAFRDISPQAPTHVLVIPKRCIRSVADAADEDETLLGSVLLAARDVARQEGLDDGFRVILNTGDEGGQTVFHLHAHVLGGRALGWPPG
ncbi:MAG: histidine triad nucleotide-binding protein [Gemmatimonadota bacterium]